MPALMTCSAVDVEAALLVSDRSALKQWRDTLQGKTRSCCVRLLIRLSSIWLRLQSSAHICHFGRIPHSIGGDAQQIAIRLATLVADGEYAAVLRNDVVADLIGTSTSGTVAGMLLQRAVLQNAIISLAHVLGC